jgi:toxin YoeB
VASSKDRLAVFHGEFRDDLGYWVQTDRKVALRALDLVEAIMRDPLVSNDRVQFLQARYHY